MIKSLRGASCWIVATVGLCLHICAPAAFATVSLSVQPQTESVFVGSNAVFTAMVTTTAGEVVTGYSWMVSQNSQGPYSAIPGANGPVFTINNAQTNNTGFYFVSITYNSSTSTGVLVGSQVATLTVLDQARLTSQPVSLTRAAGGSAAFGVTALGAAPLSYQWLFNGNALTDGGRIVGSATANLLISGLVGADAGNYSVVVTNLYGAATSHVATLTVLLPPTIDVQPQTLTILTGSNAVFTVVAEGTTPLNYHWKLNGAFLSDGGRISGSATSVLTITGALTNDDGDYSVFISNIIGSTNSQPATLTVLMPPVITSPTNALGQQGFPFTYTVTATGTTPITFGSDPLPAGLSLDTSSGIVSGIPSVFGVFDVNFYATNAAATATQAVEITLITDVPVITNALAVSGEQGQLFSYTIAASNNPTAFTAGPLPVGLSFNPTTAIISGYPLFAGSNSVTISAGNQYGTDTETLSITIASGAPVITSGTTATGTEGTAGFTYTIIATNITTNSPVVYGASPLPSGLLLNMNTGVITGTPTYGGTNTVVVSAANAWGVGTQAVQFGVTYATLPGLAICDVSHTYLSPYLLDFSFSLRDNPAASGQGMASLGNAVVRPPSDLQVTCLEDGVPIPDETASVVTHGYKKQMKTFVVLDYSYSMYVLPEGIDNMQNAVEYLIKQEPEGAQFGVAEFNADYETPAIVTGFTSDRPTLIRDIDGIRQNYVQGNYAGTRFYDAVYAALGKFTTNSDEQHFLVVMSDGNDDSSLLNTNATPVNLLISLAQTNQVKVYCVAIGPDANTNMLQTLATSTEGRMFSPVPGDQLQSQFDLMLKDIHSQYILRWATLRRAPFAFQPSFLVTVDGQTAEFNTNIVMETNIVVITNPPPGMTNITITNLTLAPLFNPTNYGGNVQVGSLRLVADAPTNISLITLRATYVPRFVREIRLHAVPNYPCEISLVNTNEGDMFNGWTLYTTNDGGGGEWLTITSPEPTNILTSLPYGIMGEMLKFRFQYQALSNAQTAFSSFTVDNTIYSNLPPGGQSFTFQSNNLFITTYATNTPPLGTPIPWLIAHGFTNNFADAEISDPNGNGFAVWQDYIAGLNPRATNSTFSVSLQPGAPPAITFNTTLGRQYTLESSTDLTTWVAVGAGNLEGVGGPVTVTDYRTLIDISNVFYRVSVSYPPGNRPY